MCMYVFKYVFKFCILACILFSSSLNTEVDKHASFCVQKVP